MIKEIIPTITPNNITDIPLIKDTLNIFLDYISEHSDISIDIKNILDQNKVPIYEEFVKIYLNGIYEVLSKSEHNEALYNALERNYIAAGLNIEDIDLTVDITKLLTEDYILTNKDYKQAKGTSTAMEYIYNIIIKSGVQNDFFKDNVGRFQYFEGENLFEYKIEGTMIDAIYEHYVKPLTHPVGWAYFYERVFYKAFTDYFDLNFVYTFSTNGLEVRCMNGDIYSKDDYLKNISHDGKQLVEDNNVEFIGIEHLGIGDNVTKRTTVYFSSGETLISTDKPRSLTLTRNNHIIINYNNYAGNCGLYLNYSVKITTTVVDDMNFENISSMASTTGKKNIVGAGNVYVGATICGETLVNKNVSVTYKSYTGLHDGADYTELFSAGGHTEDEIKSGISQNLSGKTANESYEMKQILQYCKINQNKPLLENGKDNHICEPSFIDTMSYDEYWDKRGLLWNNFNYDGAYVSEEFSIHYDINVWDTDLFFDYFQFDGKYIGGGATF